MNTSPDPVPDDLLERRTGTRGRLHLARDLLYSILRFIARHVRGFWGALAAFLTVGFVVGLIMTALFAGFAGVVGEGWTQGFDERVLQRFELMRNPLLDEIMLEVTSLGNGAVLVLLVIVASVFLWLTDHRWSVSLLLIGVLGGQFLNGVLKEAFDRPRPSIIEWGDSVTSMSFPSGHAMSAVIVYGTVAYLVARLEPTPLLRRVTWLVAILLITAIGVSRVYLGVHYPSDVLAGFLAGTAWLLFVASALTAVRFFAPRRPETGVEEQDLEAEEERAVGLRP